MMAKKRFLVMGMGVLGKSLAMTLAAEDAEVIVVDKSAELIDEIRDQVDVAMVGDITDRKMLEQIGAKNVDAAVICIGENFESALLSTAHLLDLGVKHVATRANSEMAASILRRIGAHEIFFVEHAMGKVLAHRISHSAVTHEMDLGGGYRVVQLRAPKESWKKSLSQLELPKTYNVQVIAVRTPGAEGQAEALHRASAETVIHPDDLILVSGHEKDLSRLFTAWKHQ